MIDEKLTFRQHLAHIEGKVNAVTRALYRITPNLRGPSESRRRLYANVVQSVIQYGAPIWCDAISASKRNREKLNSLMRNTNLRVIAGYRTVSLEASYVLSRIPPMHLLAQMRKRMYLRIIDIRVHGQDTSIRIREIREEETLLMHRQWALYLQRPDIFGAKLIGAMLPHLQEWLNRKHGGMTFHLSQLLTGQLWILFISNPKERYKHLRTLREWIH